MSPTWQNSSTEGCPRMAEDLVLHLYGETIGGHREGIVNHLESCAGCRGELETLRDTLQTIDRADLGGMAAAMDRLHASEAWEGLRRRLGGSAGLGARPAVAWWMKAAAAIVIAGGSFLAGTQFTWLQRHADVRPDRPADIQQSVPMDGDSRLRAFSDRTGGYFNRSRMVLLEIANADTGSDSGTIQELTRDLLRESREARQVADQIADPRIEEVVVRLEAILREVSRLSDWGDVPEVQRIRARVNECGVLDELELLIPAPARVAERRSRT